MHCVDLGESFPTQKEAKGAAPGRRQKASSWDQGTQRAKKARVTPKEKWSRSSSCRAEDICAIFRESSLSMHFNVKCYVATFKFSFFSYWRTFHQCPQSPQFLFRTRSSFQRIIYFETRCRYADNTTNIRITTVLFLEYWPRIRLDLTLQSDANC